MVRKALCVGVGLLLFMSCARQQPERPAPTTQPARAPTDAKAAAPEWDPHNAPPDPNAAPKPQWIWGPDEAKEGEERSFRTTFDAKLPNPLKTEDPSSAWIWAVADDEIEVYLNGKKVIDAVGWGTATIADIRSQLVPGENSIAVRVKNDTGPAAMAVKVEIRRQYFHPFVLVSDASWKTSRTPEVAWRGRRVDMKKDFIPVRQVGDYGMEPWGILTAATTSRATAVENLTLLPGFKAELIHSVSKRTEGSWVSMTPDPKGRLYVSDQSGPLFRVTPATTQNATKIEKVDLPMGCSQGMLWAFDSLYVVVNNKGKAPESGLYRLRDTNNDDKLDKVEHLKDFKDRSNEGAGYGEHGPHAILLGPDKKSLYVIAGNFTNIPDGIAKNSPARHWAEDQLLKRMEDGKGHDPNINAPASWVARTDPEGKIWELVAMGMRNAYDMAFNTEGELFSYDSDMEWDIGAPWYRPTRIVHLTSGSESGWRHGSGKFPIYYPDTLPPVIDMDVGSPTGVTFGTGAKFPAKYQRAFFAADWAYGKIYAVHLTPQGATYQATVEPFVIGKPFAVTDCVINSDGAMYVTIGGRGGQSGLYRITYAGEESTEPVKPVVDAKSAEARGLRKQLERFHRNTERGAVSMAWPHLGSEDRFIRFAARVAIENQPPRLWIERALAEQSSPRASINALLAVARVGDKKLQPRLIESLNRLDLTKFSEEQQLEALRVYQLAFTRMGQPGNAVASTLRARFEPLFPHKSTNVTHELFQLLTYLESPEAVSEGMKLAGEAKTQEEQMFYIFHLRSTKENWTLEQRRQYFAWLSMAEEKYKGGASFKPFLKNIREEAGATLTEAEKKSLGPSTQPGQLAAAKPAPQIPVRKFVRTWTMQDLTPKLEQTKIGRSFEKGKTAFNAVSCLKCHRFNGEGDASGPDLTGVGARFQPVDVLEAMILPSKIISDQYQDTEIITKKRRVHVGSIQKEDEKQVVLKPSPMSTATETIAKSDIVTRRPSKMSSMPQGLLDVLTEDEVLDLIAYIRSAGNPRDAAFAKAPAATQESATASPAAP